MKRWCAGALLLIVSAPLYANGPRIPADRYRALAEAWAPTIAQDYAHEFTNSSNGFNPVDHLLGLFFDGNEDLRDNAHNVFRLSKEQMQAAMERPPVYYSLIETKTHYYITYILYHAVDAKAFGHAHDTESIWLVIEKNASPYGALVAQITNAHGYPNIYSADPLKQESWRSRLPPFNFKRRIMTAMDRFSDLYHEGEPEFIERAQGKSLQVYVASRSHAIYKFRREVWKSGEAGSGAFYVPENCLECLIDVSTLRTERIYRYRLESWDEVFKKFSDTSSETVFVANNWGLFESTRGVGRPHYLAAAWGEARAAVNLFHTTSFKTPHSLADPAGMHRYFERDQESISSIYLYNPYGESAPRQSVWAAGLFSGW